MPTLTPLKSVLPTKDKVSLVTSRVYEDYPATELASQLEYNPYSFLHVLNPFYLNQQKVDNEKRLHKVNSKYEEFKSEKIIHKEVSESFFLYKIETKTNTFIGIIGGLSIDEYKQNKIKKHEDTFEYRVDLFRDFMKYAGFYTEPVLVTYPDSNVLNDWLENQTMKNPHFEFATNKKEIHYFWKIDSEKDIQFIQKTFSKMDCLYIADGHHRTESATKLHEETNKNPIFMSYLIAESNLKINEYNRVIKDLNGHSKEEFLQLLEKNFLIENKGLTLYTPEEKFTFGMYLDGNFYKLQLKENKVDKTNILQSLDTQILYDLVLNPILRIGDLRTDERIEYLPGKESVTKLKNKVDNEEFRVAFLMYKTDISEIKKIADLGLIMPPKSTYIEPKFRLGLTIFETK
jgi:uncharacterized protein (DUF1015 family)